VEHELELLIAALFHDYDHAGKLGNDALNIYNAKEGLKLFYQANPEFDIDTVFFLITCTEYPYTIPDNELSPEAKMLRDADMSYLLEDLSIVKLYSGLRKEFGISLQDFISSQDKFFNSVKFHDAYTQAKWKATAKAKRLTECEYLKKNL
jgi:hypothetical protein